MLRHWGIPVELWPLRLRVGWWDIAAALLVFGAMAALIWTGRKVAAPFTLGQPVSISLDAMLLPEYALRTTLRMFAALAASLLFSLVYAAWAVKLPRAGRILIPLLDILQSVPILGYLSITITGFIALFPGRLLGVECAAIFAIFTSQAWNMTFSLYQSFRTVPADLVEAARMYRLSPWHRFWRLEVPFAMPSLIWNMMMSMSGGWFFVVAAEAITVNGQNIMLPGIGSYIALAIEQRDLHAVGYAIATMLVVIAVYDQLMFRPLLAWSAKFKAEAVEGESELSSWFLTMVQRAKLIRGLAALARALVELSRRARGFLTALVRPVRREAALPADLDRWLGRLLDIALSVLALAGGFLIWRYVSGEVALAEAVRVLLLGLFTALRVAALILLASLVWVPVGVWIGLRPQLAQRVQPVVQFLAAFPANLFFPVVVLAIVHFRLNVEIWISPLMILGTQWYILFNVIAGASAIPTELRHVCANLGVKGAVWWRRVVLPAIFPAYVTGAVTASGGSWNASIVAEVAKWGDTTLVATGIGAYIAHSTEAGDFPRIALGIVVLCLYVTLFNRLLWRRLYNLAAERYRFD